MQLTLLTSSHQGRDEGRGQNIKSNLLRFSLEILRLIRPLSENMDADCRLSTPPVMMSSQARGGRAGTGLAGCTSG